MLAWLALCQHPAPQAPCPLTLLNHRPQQAYSQCATPMTPKERVKRNKEVRSLRWTLHHSKCAGRTEAKVLILSLSPSILHR